MNVLVSVGGFGGAVILLTAVVAIGRGIFRQINATEDNTKAMRDLCTQVAKLQDMYHGLQVRMAIVEDRIKR